MNGPEDHRLVDHSGAPVSAVSMVSMIFGLWSAPHSCQVASMGRRLVLLEHIFAVYHVESIEGRVV